SLIEEYSQLDATKGVCMPEAPRLTYTLTHPQTHTRVRAHTHTSTYTHIHTHFYTHKHTLTHPQMHLHMDTVTHKHSHPLQRGTPSVCPTDYTHKVSKETHTLFLQCLHTEYTHISTCAAH